MDVPFLNLSAQYHKIKPEIDKAIQNVLDTNAFINSMDVKEFEAEFALSQESKHCIGVANGTDALFISLKMMGVGYGDEVITVANTWISTSEAISLTGAKPVFVDIDQYQTIDPNLIEEKITSKTKAIIPVHLYGQSCDMRAIQSIADKHSLMVLEDCAQSHLASFEKKKVGNFGIAGTFSFYPGKNLGAYGDAGCIVTNDEKFETNVRRFSNHGSLFKHEHVMEGLNSRLDGIQAAVLRVKQRYLLEWTNRRRTLAQRYSDLLNDVEQVSVPKVRENTEHSFHVYSIRAERRDEMREFLRNNGIQTALHYPVILPLLKAYSSMNHKPEDFPTAFEFQNSIVSLPLSADLRDEELEYVVDKIREFYRS